LPDSPKDKANIYTDLFEKNEDARFFDDLNIEVESKDGEAARLQWLIGLAERAEHHLRQAFVLGPQSGERRYAARAAALSRFHATLRSDKCLPTLADYLRQPAQKQETLYVTE
jgi:CRISPR system Cascade subunit CasA